MNEENYKDNINMVAKKLTKFGETTLSIGVEKRDSIMITQGNILNLVGGLLLDETNDLVEFEAFLQYFTAKKILDNISPAQLMLAKSMSGSVIPGMGDIGDMLANMMGGNEDSKEFKKGLNDNSLDDILDKYTDTDLDNDPDDTNE